MSRCEGLILFVRVEQVKTISGKWESSNPIPGELLRF